MATLTNQEQTVEWLLEKTAAVLKLSPDALDENESLINYGLSSKQALVIAGELSEELGRKLNPTVLWDYPTIRDLAAYIFAE